MIIAVIPPVDKNFHLWAILNDHLLRKCSHTACMLRFSKQMIIQSRLKAENSPRFTFRGESL